MKTDELIVLQKKAGFVKFGSGGRPDQNLTKAPLVLPPRLGASVVVLFLIWVAGIARFGTSMQLTHWVKNITNDYLSVFFIYILLLFVQN